jgi:hypothetical protein
MPPQAVELALFGPVGHLLFAAGEVFKAAHMVDFYAVRLRYHVNYDCPS